ncbi:TolC family protein [uncultured Rubinisphaera sp.]|uniref:TolC family protein n=1 Tax=uncultured Rubinisphaera sp. TaxID=1678686 RepID=UPI0030D6E715
MDQTLNSEHWGLHRFFGGKSALLAMALIITLSGCSQQFWRKQADKDTYRILDEKESDPRWDNPRKIITPDPRSRFYDPSPPDFEEMPPDDPAAATDMERPNGIPGYKGWHKYGRAMGVENPVWLANFEFTPEMMDENTGEYICPLPKIENLTILDAVELSYLNGREYQFQLEQTYLAALALTLERFRFQVRYLGIGGGEPGGGLTYENVPGVQDSLRMNSRFGVSQLLPTGGQWAMELANNTLWIFSGPNAGTNSASILSYRLVQPLLLNAGRKIALEGLTQAERDVLYSIRDLARFRKELFVDTVGGGYLGLLTQLQSIRNQEYNIEQLERQVIELRVNAGAPPGNIGADLEAFPAELVIPDSLVDKLRYDDIQKELVWSGAMSAEEAQQLLSLSDDVLYMGAARELVQFLRSEVTPFDVIQIESRLASSRINLLTSRQRYQESLDSYKIQLGLPPDFEMTIDDSGLEQFELIDPAFERLRDEIEESISIVGLLDNQAPVLEQAKLALVELERLYQKLIEESIPLVDVDARKVQESKPGRLAKIQDEETRERILDTMERDAEQLVNLKGEISALSRAFERIRIYLEQGESDQASLVRAIEEILDLREDLLVKAQGLQVIQVGLRSELIDINRYEFNLNDSIGLALENRLDLMNRRGLVMDARRTVDVIANRLKAVLDVVVEGDIRTEPGTSRPFDFSGQSSSHRVGIQFTAPLDQVAERNQYRAAQVNYQRARRDYMEFEDNVKLQIRTSWRDLQVLEQNLETARQSLRINVLQYDQAVEESNAPGGTSNSGVRGRNIIDALNNILDSQNRLVLIWANYERSRLAIYRDMGIMEIDEQGLWIDPFYQRLYDDVDARFKSGPPIEPNEFCPPLTPAGEYDLTLLPPGPNDYGNFSPGTNESGSDVGFENGDLPGIPPVSQEERPFVADPLRWNPGAGLGDDVRDGSLPTVRGPEFYRELGRISQPDSGTQVPLVPAPDQHGQLVVPE